MHSVVAYQALFRRKFLLRCIAWIRFFQFYCLLCLNGKYQISVCTGHSPNWPACTVRQQQRCLLHTILRKQMEPTEVSVYGFISQLMCSGNQQINECAQMMYEERRIMAFHVAMAGTSVRRCVVRSRSQEWWDCDVMASLKQISSLTTSIAAVSYVCIRFSPHTSGPNRNRKYQTPCDLCCYGKKKCGPLQLAV